ncbi:MAG: hypothetical protein JHD16_05915 [Solirubrobacteraceae bacterium]|nr:hypothetical protein [Solirubrobacteraceae bacterium]
MRRPHLLLLGVTALLLAGTPSVALAGAGEGVGYRLTGQPGSTLTRGFIRLPASPGSTVTASFIASNSTKKAVNVVFYGADGNTTRATGAVFGNAKPSDAGTWISPSRGTATLPAGSELEINVAVRVPGGTGVGDHVGAVIMEQLEGTSSANVKQVVRYAIPILVDIAGGPGAQLRLGEARLGRISGTDIATVFLPMRNTGTRICRPVVSASVGASGAAPMTVQRQLDEILPGDEISYPLRMADSMNPGTYLVRADVTGCGQPVSTSASSTLENSDEATQSPQGGGAKNTGGDGGDSDITPVPLRRATGGGGGGDDNGGASNRRDSSPAGDTDSTSAGDGAVVPVAPVKPPGGSSSGKSWLSKAGDAIAENAPKVLERASIPLGASALVGLLFFFQNALDRRDPKLAGAPRERDAALRFDPNPLQS